MNAADHRGQAVAPHRHERRQLQLRKQLVDRKGENFRGRLSGESGQQDGDQPAHDLGIAIGDEFQRPRSGRGRLRNEPDAGLAAEDAVFFRFEMLVERRQRAADLDQVRRAIDRIVELGELGANFVQRNGNRHFQDAPSRAGDRVAKPLRTRIISGRRARRVLESLQPGEVVFRGDVEGFGRQCQRQVVKLAEREHLLHQVARMAVAERAAGSLIVLGEQIIDGFALILDT